MSSVWGKNIILSIFGESHGRAIGITIDGLPSGVELDFNQIYREMQRRAPGKNKLSTQRQEGDEFEILSGYFENRTTGTPLSCIIFNRDENSKDYSEIRNKMRPSHADYTGRVRYGGYNDHRGGGHFSGRVTAPLTFAGAVAKQILMKENIIIGSHIKSIGNIEENNFDSINLDKKLLERLTNSDFPVLNVDRGSEMKNAILRAREEKDSVGGIIETAVLNIEPGIGSPFFDSVESTLSHLLFSIPAVKGVEFGAGFDIASMRGSVANDEMYFIDGSVKTYSNNNGGILGGITNGMPLIFRTAFKPTPSISRCQRTVDMASGEGTLLEITGRHDPCIVPRAVPVVEAAAALGILDLLMEVKGRSWESLKY